MSVSSLQNFYEATLTRNWTATTGDFNVSVAPSISSGYIVISPSDRVRREIVKFSATGTNGYGPFITVSNISDRGVGGTTAQTHTIGEKVRMNITAQHWDELIASAVAPTVDVGTTTTLDPGSDATATNSGTDVAAVIDFEIPAGSTIYSGTSIPDNSVGRNGDWAFDTSVNSYVWYKSGGTWALVNSLKGATGDGNGIASIVKTGTVGLVDTYTITYDDATTSTFNITNGAKGDTGDAGVSVVSIIKTSTVGLVDTYTITYSNSTTSTFTVTNGQDGTNGIDGTDGISFTPKGAYNALTEYVANDVVSYLGSTWIALQTTTGNIPEEGAYWTLNALKGTDGEGSGDVSGPASSTNNNVAVFDGITGKLIKDGGATLASKQDALGFTPENVANKENTTLDTSTTKYPTNRLVKEYADAKVEDSIVDGHTTVAPSGNAVFDALAGKLGLSGGTMTGDVTLGENTSIALDPAGSADGKYTGITITGTSGYSQSFGDLVYLDPTDSRWEACDANSASGADGDARGILGMVVSAGTDGNACKILLHGVIRADAKFPSFTINNPIYVSETAGEVTQTQPTTADVVIRIVGSALTADEMYFNPDRIWITHI